MYVKIQRIKKIQVSINKLTDLRCVTFYTLKETKNSFENS